MAKAILTLLWAVMTPAYMLCSTHAKGCDKLKTYVANTVMTTCMYRQCRLGLYTMQRFMWAHKA